MVRRLEKQLFSLKIMSMQKKYSRYLIESIRIFLNMQKLLIIIQNTHRVRLMNSQRRRRCRRLILFVGRLDEQALLALFDLI